MIYEEWPWQEVSEGVFETNDALVVRIIYIMDVTVHSTHNAINDSQYLVHLKMLN